jgi:hypothetical protein
MSNNEKVIKLVTKLGQLDDKIADLTVQRDQTCAEINQLIQKTAPQPTAAKTSPTTWSKKTAPSGETLGSKIQQILDNIPTGQTLTDLASKLKVTPQQISLSIHHLKTAGKIFQNGSVYVTATPMMVAAKTAPAAPMGSYVTPDDEETDI